MAAIDVDREQVLAYRVGAHQFDRSVAKASQLAVLDLGVADTPPGSARQALAARLPALPEPDDDLVTVWGARGAPFVHRGEDLAGLAAALLPRDEADAKARLGGSSGRVPGGDLDAVLATASALHELVSAPLSKGEASTALTARLPHLATYCRGCQVDHVSEQLVRIAGLPAGVRIEPGTTPLVLAPLDEWTPPTDPVGLAGPARTYLRLHGPATQSEVAAYFTADKAAIRDSWPDDLIEVVVDGKKGYWLPAEAEPELRAPAPPEFVRLLPPSDPYLQTRNRNLLVPEKAEQKALWRPISNPGAILADGEIVGAWRARLSGKRLTVTPEAFRPLPPPVLAAIEDEARVVAAVRGASDVRVTA
ncbi:DNA glycosylase AlkZ-like family protein [Cryptosporangium aurantiacum]|uniref:Winged helix DNA-binding domain-containing protein n=1 Tax=Cryptosporangium aurantiacum TaxID=134849 RepID=A0A1M7RL66_9ACTN|nr:crosslink repair DNA glycosylase YcaQ family protein [Cryptosporangium aurantiacum]SHN46890.1 Winged helix DNA-binding domain-containing protein [Cryptosporangium aurantiacum]